MHRFCSTSLSVFSRPPRLPSVCVTATQDCSIRFPSLSQRRPFLKPSALDSLFAATTPLRELTHTRVIPYPRSAVFDTIASVERYPAFLPFVLSADVSERDQNHRPTRASLKVGYNALGIQETWDSIVCAKEEQGVIEATGADVAQKNSDGIFELLKTKWQLRDVKDVRWPGAGDSQTAIRLDVEVKFRSAIYDKIFAGVEEKVAEMMVRAFEKRLKDLAHS